jgi:hypothetical protein
VTGVTAAGLISQSDRVEALAGVVPQRLQHLVAGRSGRAAIGVEHRLGHQAGQGVEHIPGLGAGGGGHGLGGRGVERGREHPQMVKHRLLAIAEQGVGPVDGCPQGVVAFYGGPATAGKQPEAFVEMGGDLPG